MKSETEIRLEVIKHIAQMIYRMSEEALSPEEELLQLEDLEEVASHLLDSLSFSPSVSENGVDFTASLSIIPVDKYVEKYFAENPLA